MNEEIKDAIADSYREIRQEILEAESRCVKECNIVWWTLWLMLIFFTILGVSMIRENNSYIKEVKDRVTKLETR